MEMKRPLKRLLDVRDRKWPTSDPTAWQLDAAADDDNDLKKSTHFCTGRVYLLETVYLGRQKNDYLSSHSK